MGVGSETVVTASRNRIVACTLGRKSRADWIAASVRGEILFFPWMARLVREIIVLVNLFKFP